MTMPSIGIKDLLIAATPTVGVFGNPTPAQIVSGSWGIFISKQPDDKAGPDRCITIYDNGGLAPNPRWGLDYPAIQIIVRGEQNEYEATYNKCKEIQKVLLGIPAQDVNGDRWNHLNQDGDSSFIGYDSNRRPEFTMNFSLIIEPALPVGSHRDPL